MSKKLLGVTIDDNLSRKDHIKQQNLYHIPVNKFMSSLYYAEWNNISPFNPRESFYNYYIRPDLNNCCSAWEMFFSGQILILKQYEIAVHFICAINYIKWHCTYTIANY